MSKLSLELSKAEIDHLLAHLEANGQETGTNYDWYFGNRKQFEIRHENLKQKLKKAGLNQKSCYCMNEEIMKETIEALEWALKSLGWFLDYAGSEDYVARWDEAYDPKGALRAVCSALTKLKEEKEASNLCRTETFTK